MLSSSVAQLILNAEPVGNFFCSPLKSDQVAGRGDNIGLPSVGMVSANSDLQTGRSDFRGNHVGKTFRRNAFLDHGEFSQNKDDRDD
jgi:hypothetical protein